MGEKYMFCNMSFDFYLALSSMNPDTLYWSGIVREMNRTYNKIYYPKTIRDWLMYFVDAGLLKRYRMDGRTVGYRFTQKGKSVLKEITEINNLFKEVNR